MKTLCLSVLLALLPGGERERGLQLYREGRFAEAAAAFRAAIAQDGDSAELQWNLALASWRAGDLAAAETAAEKYAALARDARTDLHAGLLGAVRHDEAKALAAKAASAGAAPPAAPGAEPEDPLPLLEQALQKAQQARDHFVRGASANATPELLRNTERALRTIDELQRQIDEQKKQREQQQKDDKKNEKQDDKKDEKQDDKKDGEKQDGKKDGEKQADPKAGKPEAGKPDEKPQPQPGQPKPDDKPGQEPPEPQPGQGEPQPEPKAGKADGQEPKPEPDAAPPEPKPGEARQDAPGEGVEGRELTPEQTQRLLQQLQELDARQKTMRARLKSGRRPVERDW